MRKRTVDAMKGVKKNGQKTGTAIAEGAVKAKTPLIAGGAAVAGLAGGAVLARGGASRAVGKLARPRAGARTSTAKALGLAAKEVGKAGFQVGQLASEVRRVREAVKSS